MILNRMSGILALAVGGVCLWAFGTWANTVLPLLSFASMIEYDWINGYLALADIISGVVFAGAGAGLMFKALKPHKHVLLALFVLIFVLQIVGTAMYWANTWSTWDVPQSSACQTIKDFDAETTCNNVEVNLMVVNLVAGPAALACWTLLAFAKK